jgi:hypothetical protein
VLRVLRDSEDDTALPDLTQQVLQQIRLELARDTNFERPGAPWEAAGDGYRREYFFSAGQEFLNPATPEAERPPVYYRILAELKAPPPTVAHLPGNAVKTLILKAEWPWNALAGKPRNRRIYPLLLHNRGYRQWAHPQGNLGEGGLQ